MSSSYLRIIIAIISLQLISCTSCHKNNETVLKETKDSSGRVIEKIVSGYMKGEGSYQKTFIYDIEGRLLEERGVVNGVKHKISYSYLGDSAYTIRYFQLGNATAYTDSVFIANENHLAFSEYIKLNNTGKTSYEFRMDKELDPDTTRCHETFYDINGALLETREVPCNKASYFDQQR